MGNAQFLGWDISFYDSTNDIEYTSEIVDLDIGQDISTSLVTAIIKFSVDTTFTKYFVKKHEGTLTLTNKMIYTEDVDEMFMIDLQSITNVGSILERAEDTTDRNITLFTIRYMCKDGIQLINQRVGGIYEKKKIEDIIKDLYKKTNCTLKLDMEIPTNSTQYDMIMIPDSSFIESIRYLNQNYGLYDTLMFMYGNTFINKGSTSWKITNINKGKQETIQLKYTPHEQSAKRADAIAKKIYYTYLPVNIQNNFSQIIKKVPEMLQLVAFDNDKFIKRKDILFTKTLKDLQFQESTTQFEEEMEIEKQLYSLPRFDMSDYSIKQTIQNIGINAFDIPDIVIPNPFKVSHFKIGTVIDFDTQSTGFIDANINLMVVGWHLKIRQGNGVGGGAAYSTNLGLRTVATSYLKNSG